MPTPLLSRPVRTALVGALLLLTSSCCFRGCGSTRSTVPPVKAASVAQVPETLEALRTLHAPPDVVVSVRTYKPSGGGPACGHSAACVIVLPIVLLELLTQQEVNAVEVTRGGLKTLDAIYDQQGRLVSAILLTPEGQRAVARIKLPELGHDVIVERSTSVLEPDGGLRTVDRRLLEQLPLDAEYRKAFAEASSHDKGLLLEEAFSLVQGELDDFVLGELRAPTLDADARHAATSSLCGRTPQREQAEAFVEAALSQPSAKAALRALDCKGLSVGLREKAAAASLPAYCTGTSELSFEVTLSSYKALNGLDLSGLPADCPPERAALLRLSRGLRAPGDGEAVARALLSDFYEDAAEDVVDLKDPVQRAWILTALRTGPADELLDFLEDSAGSLSPSEVEPLLRVARAQPEGRAGYKLVSRITSLLGKSQDEAVVGELRRLVTGELKEQGMLALAAHGDAGGRREVAAALRPKQGVPLTNLLLLKKADLAAYMLVEGGCDADKLEQALKKGVEGAVEAACGAPR